MGSGVTNFLSTVEVQSIGTADIDKMAAAIDKQTASLDKLRLSATKVNEHPGFSAFAEKVKQGIQDPLGAIGSAAESALRAIGPLGAGVASTAGVFAAAGLAAFEAAKSLGDYATQIENTALRTGLTTKEVSLFSFAAKAAGQDVTVFESAMRKLSQGLVDNSSVGKIAREGLSELGVSAYGADGKLRPMSDIFFQLSGALNAIEDPAKRNAEALKVFGRAGIELLPTILGLANNLQRAKDIGLGVSDADIKRWEEYHKQIAAAEAQWDLLARKFKEPMASLLMVTIKGVMGDNSDVTAAAVQALKGQIGKLSPDEAQGRLDFLRNSGMVPKNTQQELQDQINHAADKNLFAPQRTWQNTGLSVMGYQSAPFAPFAFDLSGYTRQVTEALGGIGDQGELKDEKEKLVTLQDELRAKRELKAPLTQQADLANQVTTQKAVVEGIEARIKATRDLAAEQKALLELDKQSSEIFLKAVSAGGTVGEKYNEALAKIEVERHAWFESHPGGSPADQAKANFDFNKQAGAATMTRDAEWRQALIDGDKKGQELVKTYLEGIDKASRESVKAGEDFYKEHPEIFGMRPQDRQFLTGFASPEQALRNAHDNERRALGLYGGQAALAGIPEITQARTLEALRRNAADEEYRALSRKAAITNDIQGEQDAIDQRHQKYLDAELERQQALLQMALRQKQEFQSLVVGGVEALIHGQAAAFGQHFATDLLDKVIGNAAGMVWKDVSKIIPHASDPNSKIGQVLQGTMFGADPLKVATGLNTTATDLNTKALDDLIAALAAERANALSASGAGGGFSSAAVARIMAGTGGYSPTPHVAPGGEAIGSGDSTAGLIQLPNGLWQRGPAVQAETGAGVEFPAIDPYAWMQKGATEQNTAEVIRNTSAMFGSDPLKGVTDQNTAETIRNTAAMFSPNPLKGVTDQNTTETIRNTAAMFATDPLKGVMDQNTTETIRNTLAMFGPNPVKRATDLNTRAVDDLTAELAAKRSFAVSHVGTSALSPLLAISPLFSALQSFKRSPATSVEQIGLGKLDAAGLPRESSGLVLRGSGQVALDPLKVATGLNTTATDLNTKALDDLTALFAEARVNALSASGAGGGSSSAGGGFSSAASTYARIMAGAGFTPASSMSWGGGLEVIGSGDSTAGLTQLPSGLWQRGPVGSDAASPGGATYNGGYSEPSAYSGAPGGATYNGGYSEPSAYSGAPGGATYNGGYSEPLGSGYPGGATYNNLPGMTLSKGVGMAGAAVAGGFGIYSGIKAGGVQGDLAAGGSAAAAASAIMMMAGVTGPLAPILMGVGLVLPLISSLFGDPKKNRANEIDTWLLQHQFHMPAPVSIERDTRGRDVSYDMRGNLQPIQQTVNNNNHYDSSTHVGTLSAIDTQDVSRFFANHAAAVNKGVARAIDEGGELVPKLASAMGLQ